MISLPDSDDVPVDLFLPPLVALFFPLLLSHIKIDFVSCRLQNYFFCFILFFSQTQLAMQLPAKQTQPATQLAMHFPAEKQPGSYAHLCKPM